MSVQILLSTYNGERYLSELLDSILGQTYQNWSLLIRDDGSSDSTLEVISKYIAKDCRISLLNSDKNLGVISSFETLLKASTSPYVMFCDQDDVWLSNKIELLHSVMVEAEKDLPNKPILVHSDLLVVDSNLNVISHSFWQYSQIDITKRDFNYLGVKNFVTGCTMMFNRVAVESSLPFEQETRMHDAWVALKVLKTGGVIKSIETPTIMYRQHENNVVGAIGQGNIFKDKLLKIKSVIRDNSLQWKMLKQVGYGSFIKYLYYKIRIILG